MTGYCVTRGTAIVRLFCLAALNLTKLKEYRHAIDVYSRIQTGYSKSRTSSGLPFALIAQLEKASCYRMLGEPAKSLQVALEVYAGVVHDSWDLDESQFKAYASLGEEAVSSALRESGEEKSRNYEEEFEQLKTEHQARIDRWEVIAVLERESLPELTRKYHELGSYTKLPLRQVNTVDEKDLLVTAVMIPDQSKKELAGDPRCQALQRLPGG